MLSVLSSHSLFQSLSMQPPSRSTILFKPAVLNMPSSFSRLSMLHNHLQIPSPQVNCPGHCLDPSNPTAFPPGLDLIILFLIHRPFSTTLRLAGAPLYLRSHQGAVFHANVECAAACHSNHAQSCGAHEEGGFTGHCCMIAEGVKAPGDRRRGGGCWFLRRSSRLVGCL